MPKLLILLLSAALATPAFSEITDPVAHIKERGYDSASPGKNSDITFYSRTERISSSRLKQLEKEVADLPKQPEILQVCEIGRGGAKAKLYEQQIYADVATTDYGYQGSSLVCVLKYMYQEQVGTQVMVARKEGNGLYLMFYVSANPK